MVSSDQTEGSTERFCVCLIPGSMFGTVWEVNQRRPPYYKVHALLQKVYEHVTGYLYTVVCVGVFDASACVLFLRRGVCGVSESLREQGRAGLGHMG